MFPQPFGEGHLLWSITLLYVFVWLNQCGCGIVSYSCGKKGAPTCRSKQTQP